jgi:hypothetical protein
MMDFFCSGAVGIEPATCGSEENVITKPPEMVMWTNGKFFIFKWNESVILLQ